LQFYGREDAKNGSLFGTHQQDNGRTITNRIAPKRKHSIPAIEKETQ